jgi:hypothetical protein
MGQGGVVGGGELPAWGKRRGGGHAWTREAQGRGPTARPGAPPGCPRPTPGWGRSREDFRTRQNPAARGSPPRRAPPRALRAPVPRDAARYGRRRGPGAPPRAPGPAARARARRAGAPTHVLPRGVRPCDLLDLPVLEPALLRGLVHRKVHQVHGARDEGHGGGAPAAAGGRSVRGRRRWRRARVTCGGAVLLPAGRRGGSRAA